MQPRVILDSRHFKLTIDRLCHQLIENHGDFTNTCLIGVQPRGIHLSDRIYKRLQLKLKGTKILYGKLDVTFHRDDYRRRDKPILPSDTTLDFSIENMCIILIDDVFFTGRTIRSAMDALLYFGRPAKIELLTLVDRRFSRHVPVQPDYIGKTVDSVSSEYVKVEWEELNGRDQISIFAEKDRS